WPRAPLRHECVPRPEDERGHRPLPGRALHAPRRRHRRAAAHHRHPLVPQGARRGAAARLDAPGGQKPRQLRRLPCRRRGRAVLRRRREDSTMSPDAIKVWDLPTRLFHWLLASTFAGAWLTGDSERWMVVHTLLGYTFAGLIAFRLVWGFVG